MTPHEFKSTREQMGLSQAALAGRLGCHVMSVWKWENGARKISPMTARLLALLASQTKTTQTGQNPS